MKVLAVTEQREGKFKKSSFETVGAAQDIAKTLGAECAALVIGSGIQGIAQELERYGATRILVVDDPKLERQSNAALAAAVAAVAVKENADLIFMSASQMGKDVAPRVAVKLRAGLASDCIALNAENGDLVGTRPIYAGKALVEVRVATPVKIFTLRPNVFTATERPATASVELVPVLLEEKEFRAVVTHTEVSTGRPDVTEADTIVSGGRGLKAPENFALVEELAEVLGAGVGASRAVVDAGWRPHSEQVGQTGKTVAPTLYIALGISGAVQHLAGMSSSKYIVAINKDKDAPIFQVADYGIVGDVFEVLPELIAELKKATGK